MFIFKKRKIVVDAYTDIDIIAHSYKVAPAAQFIPEWWRMTDKRTLDKGFIPAPTIRTCTGILDLYATGIMVPLWTDIALSIGPDDISWQCADMATEITTHDSSQWDKFADPMMFGHLKITSKWVLRTKENINWVFQEPYWNKQIGSPISTPPGVINFHHTAFATNIQLMVDKSTPQNVLLEAGTPIAHLIPLSDRPIEVVTHLVSTEELRKIEALPRTKFINGYKHRINQGVKCPFHK
jgi:hypothetical protein